MEAADAGESAAPGTGGCGEEGRCRAGGGALPRRQKSPVPASCASAAEAAAASQKEEPLGCGGSEGSVDSGSECGWSVAGACWLGSWVSCVGLWEDVRGMESVGWSVCRRGEPGWIGELGLLGELPGGAAEAGSVRVCMGGGGVGADGGAGAGEGDVAAGRCGD